MAEQLTVNKIKDSYIAYINAHYVSDEDARRIKDEFDRLRAENAELRELTSELYQCSRQCGCDCCGYKDGCSMFDRMAQLGIEVNE